MKRFGILFLISLIPFIIYFDLKEAESYQIEGVIVGIEWKSNNHQLPKFTIQNKAGVYYTISHHSIILNKSAVKIGDKISKVKGSSYCEINGKKVLFEKTFWE